MAAPGSSSWLTDCLARHLPAGTPKRKGRRRKPPAAASFRQEREDGWFRPHPAHPWLDPATLGEPGHVPARHGVAVDGKESRGARKGGGRKVHLLAAVTHVPGLVIAQDRVAKAGKANEVSHFRPLLAPLPLAGAVITSDAMQCTRDNALSLRQAKDAHYLWRRQASGSPGPRPSSTSPASPQARPRRRTCSPTSAATGGWSTRTGYAT